MAGDDTGAWLVVGADGGIGSRLLERLTADGRPAVGTTRRPDRAGGVTPLLDLAAPPDAWDLPGRVAVAFLCAAVTSTEQCVRDPSGTRRVNVDRTVGLARRVHAGGGRAVFLSTNQVFDGTRPHRPADDATCPATEYGRQKADAEREILALGGAVVRLTKVFTSPPPHFTTWADALRAGNPVAPFSDMVFAPVPPGVVTAVLVTVAVRAVRGVVQVSGDRDVSYAEAAGMVAARLGADPGLVRPVTAASRGLPPAAAPRHTTLDTARLTGELGAAVPPVTTTLDGLIGRWLPYDPERGRRRSA